MALLRLNESTGEVYVSDEGKHLSCIKNLEKKDKTKGRVYFNNSLRYTYHVYKKEHDLSFLSFNQRKLRVINEYLPDQNSDKFENDKLVQEVIKEYKLQQYTPNELFYESIKEDFNELRDYIKDIPLRKKIKIDEIVEVSFEDDEGKTHIKEVQVKKEVYLDNSKEKFDALKRAGELIDLSNLLQEKIKNENKVNKEREYTTLLQDRKL